MVNVDTLVNRMQSSGRRGVDQPESGIDRVKRRTGDSKVDISDVTDDTMTYDASKSEDTVQYAEVREEVRRSVERLRLEVEMASSQREMGGVELSPEALAKGFTCPEDFQIREERIEYGDGVYYEGEVLGKMRHGRGVYRDATGAEYSGEFRYDVVEGKARAKMPDGSTYDGDWVAGNPHGMGKSTYPNGGCMKATLKRGHEAVGERWYLSMEIGMKVNGRMIRFMERGGGRMPRVIFPGRFDAGERVHGKFASHDGSEEYVGEWRGAARHGKGMLYIKSFGKYDGEFKDDAPHGEGTCIYVDGSVYEGEFMKGVRCGKGILKRDSFLYRKGKKDGKGRMQYHSGTAYEGEVRMTGNRHGRGARSDSPYPVRLLPGAPCYKTSLIRGEGKAWATCGQEAKFEILIRDKFGNCCSGHQWQDLIRLKLRLEGSLSEKHVDCTPTGDGRLLCSYSAPEEEGYYRLHIENDKGIAVPGTPFSVHVSNGQKAAVSQEDQVENSTTIPDTNRFWEQVAMESYMQDGNVAGWDSADDETESPEDNYSKSHPGVPVVENLEDLWLVSKLQQERKSKEEENKQKKLQEMRSKLQDTFGPGQEPSIDEAQNAMKEIIEGEMKQAVAELQAPDQKNASQGEKKQRDLHVLAASLDDLA
eukprot:jgi/Picre1/31880/NNA_007228.t1